MSGTSSKLGKPKRRLNHLKPDLQIERRLNRSDVEEGQSEQNGEEPRECTLTDLPDCALENVLKFCSYEQIAKMRILSKRMNEMCGRHLNKGFRLAEKYHQKCLKEIKAKLPKRESERRYHRLSRHCDTLNAVETRISLLSMTFMKYVDMNMCYFIPGKVIDELFKILRYIQNVRVLPVTHELLQELRDISSMAMEHFDEKIFPTLGHSSNSSCFATPKLPTSANYLTGLSSLFTSPGSPGVSNNWSIYSSQTYSERLMASEKKNRLLDKKIKRMKSDFRKQTASLKSSLQDQSVTICSLQKLIGSQQLVISSMSEKMKELEKQFLKPQEPESAQYESSNLDKKPFPRTRLKRKQSSKLNEEKDVGSKNKKYC